jgi:hypothetical protein
MWIRVEVSAKRWVILSSQGLIYSFEIKDFLPLVASTLDGAC